MKRNGFDRSAEDLGNIVGLEHVNLVVSDHRLSTLFYITGLGFTRDPYLNTGIRNMWVNLGRNQFHLPVGTPQKLRGRIGLVAPDLSVMAKSLEGVRKYLADTRFAFTVRNSRIDVTCPWGNSMYVHAPDRKKFGPTQLGMPYIELDTKPGTAEGIARYYRDIFGAKASVETGGGPKGGARKKPLKAARVSVGDRQWLIFRETEKPIPEYDGHHIAIYVANFSEPHDKVAKLGLEMEESDQWQYRVYDIVDPRNGKALYRIEHEVRSMTHPLYGRPFVNRNPVQSNQTYGPGHDAMPWGLAYSA